jgi:uncharacterized protein YijF (DUF1287 family)
VQRKLLGIISVDFDASGQLLTIQSAFDSSKAAGIAGVVYQIVAGVNEHDVTYKYKKGT